MGKEMIIMKNQLLRMNLQFFAEDTGADGGGNPEATAETVDVDNLSDEQVASLKEKFGFKTDEEVNSLIDSKFSKWQEKTDKEKAEATKLAKMNEDEVSTYEKEQLEARLAEYERKENLSKMSETASEMLTNGNVTATKDVLGLLVTEDAETTSANVKAYLKAIELEREAIKTDFEKRLGTKETLDGTSKTNLSRGAQLAAEANKKQGQPQQNAWGN